MSRNLRSAQLWVWGLLPGMLWGAADVQSAEGDLFVPPVETHFIDSRFVQQRYKVQVMRPAQKRGEVRRFPVVYATDGNVAFDALKGISWSMQGSERDAPRYILVGIGYPGDSPLVGAVLRGRDLTFPGYPKASTAPAPIEGVLVPKRGSKDYFGAQDFQHFIREELIPLIDATYRTIPGDRIYFGHSAGGGFGLYTLFTAPDLFRAYIVSSPGIIYQGNDFALRYVRDFVASGKTLPPITLYMSVGSEEEFDPVVEQWQLTSSFYRMIALLNSSALPGLDVRPEVIPGATHMTVWPQSFIHGIQAVFHRGLWGTEGKKAVPP